MNPKDLLMLKVLSQMPKSYTITQDGKKLNVTQNKLQITNTVTCQNEGVAEHIRKYYQGLGAS
jgi:hypothetical protein